MAQRERGGWRGREREREWPPWIVWVDWLGGGGEGGVGFGVFLCVPYACTGVSASMCARERGWGGGGTKRERERERLRSPPWSAWVDWWGGGWFGGGGGE